MRCQLCGGEIKERTEAGNALHPDCERERERDMQKWYDDSADRYYRQGMQEYYND